MKRMIVIFCMLSPIIINAQSIDYKNFKEEMMNDVTFRMLKDYTSLEGGYYLFRSSSERHNIYKFIKKNNEKILLNAISSKINERIPALCVGILDSISCNGFIEYQEIARRCLTDWTNSPPDAFFMIGWGNMVEVTSYYSKRSETVYISVVYQNYQRFPIDYGL